jgi:hypothetical protein
MRRSVPIGAWIAAGLVGAALLVPVAVDAATPTLSQIAGINGSTLAQVSRSNQLYATPADASSSFVLPGMSLDQSTGCYDLGSIPAGKAAVVTAVRYGVFAGDPSSLDQVELFTGPGCGSGVGSNEFAAVAAIPGNGEYSFTPGVGLPTGTDLSMDVKDDSGKFAVELWVDGYTVPSNAVPTAPNVLAPARRGSS